ncbi:MAG: acyloxyacyl hydrolase [Paludibacter sp.]|nr:acyloxyacyl hydrolase [Paludibacter sp.]
MRLSAYKIGLFFFLFINSISTFAQDDRAQLPLALRNAYFGVNIGSINYDFGAAQFQAPAGYMLNNVVVNHAAVRLVLYGYEFNKYLSAQLTYMRPVSWVFYYYDRGLEKNVRSSVWMNVGGLTLRPELPISKRFSLNGEVGLGIVTRHGFNAVDGTPIISGVTYPSVLLGGGVNYHINDNWRLVLGATYSPENTSVNQPATTFISAGFNYKLSPVSEQKLKNAAETGYINPKQWLQIGYSSNVLGYGVNNTLEKAVLFWGGDAEVFQGLTLSYHRNIFHTAKVFALDWGVSASGWQTKGVGSGLSNPNKQSFFTLSVFPVLRFNFLHTQPLDAYFYYSVAGPTYISKIIIDGNDTGQHFTFQDNMGVGMFFGENRNWNAEIKIGHYSNGNIFSQNAAVKIPLSLNFGYAF